MLAYCLSLAALTRKGIRWFPAVCQGARPGGQRRWKWGNEEGVSGMLAAKLYTGSSLEPSEAHGSYLLCLGFLCMSLEAKQLRLIMR